MSDQVQEIKEKLNIVDVISGYLRLQKAGVNFKGLCPFHNEKTPSFMVSPSRQSWYCFGSCGEGGDIFTFIEKIEGVEFPEALKILAEKAGIILKYDNPKLRSEKDKAYEICEKATQFFTASLNNANVILDYLHKRGLKDKTIDEWRLGYAPDSWGSLLLFLGKYGYREPEIEKAGLILRGVKYHDRFRNRLMFPIFDTNGRVVAFSGRIMNDIMPSKTEKADSGKYINSPETILYNKRRILYGLDRAKTEIRKADKVILVEGQMDVLLPWQDGIRNIVATSGTALTEDHLLVLKRLTSNLTLAFDMDEAGARATERGDLAAVQSGFNISVVNLLSGKDPADFVKENPGEFSKIVNMAESIMSYYFRQTFKRFSPSGGDEISLEGKKFIAVDLLSKIKRLSSAVERSNWIRELSLRINVPERDLSEEMERLEIAPDERTQNTFPSSKANIQAKTRKEILSERLLALLLKKPELIAEAVKAAVFLPKNDFEVLGALVASRNSFSETRSALPADLRPHLDFLYLAGDYELEKVGADFNVNNEIKFLIEEIEREHYKEILQKIGQEIKKCEVAAPEGGAAGQDLNKLTEEFKNISKKLYILSKNNNNLEIYGKKEKK
ncbi:MAG: DNA primase [bacterium]|nr:DNA primase [bacterium]